jgi:hypothetical protein
MLSFERKFIPLTSAGLPIYFLGSVTSLARKAEIPPLIRQPIVAESAGEWLTVDRDPQFWSEVIHV